MSKPNDENKELTMEELEMVKGAKFEVRVVLPLPQPENSPIVTLVNNLVNALGNQENSIAKNLGS